jgi:copper type II ascorbate-dependent monooxygenase-like protein
VLKPCDPKLVLSFRLALVEALGVFSTSSGDPNMGVPYLDLYGIFPHMHERGISLDAQIARADGSEVCAVDVPRWDFGWQLLYFYNTPVRVGPGDRLRTRCNYDTRGLTSPLLPGWGTQSEMCLAGLVLALPPRP